jgi:hypothetical protein
MIWYKWIWLQRLSLPVAKECGPWRVARSCSIRPITSLESWLVLSDRRCQHPGCGMFRQRQRARRMSLQKCDFISPRSEDELDVLSIGPTDHWDLWHGCKRIGCALDLLAVLADHIPIRPRRFRADRGEWSDVSPGWSTLFCLSAGPQGVRSRKSPPDPLEVSWFYHLSFQNRQVLPGPGSALEPPGLLQSHLLRVKASFLSIHGDLHFFPSSNVHI